MSAKVENELSDEATVEYEITARVLAAHLPEPMDCFATFNVTFPTMVDEEEQVGHAEKTTCLLPASDAPRWTQDDEGLFIHVSALPHTMMEVSLWCRKNGVDETYGSYKLWLKPDHFEESKTLRQAWVPLSGTKFNIPHPDDVAAQRAYDEDPDRHLREPPVPVKPLPQLQVELFCRQVPLAGQCDHCRAVMRDPLADDLERGDLSREDLEALSQRAPFTLPCAHTVCGGHLLGSMQCPCCQTKVHDANAYHNFLVDKYLELRLSEFSKTCSNCEGPRARIFCPECRFFFCSKCDAAIHDRNLFFRSHVRKDARKPFRIHRANVHHCADHHEPLIIYDSSRPQGHQAMCQLCVEASDKSALFERNAAGKLLTAGLGHDDVCKDYESYHRALLDDVRRRVDALQRVTSRDLQLYQVEVLAAQAAVDAAHAELAQSLAQLADTLPGDLTDSQAALLARVDALLKGHVELLDKQSALWASCAVGLLKQNNMVEYVVGPVLDDETRVVIPERAAKLDLTQLYQIRLALLSQFQQKFSHAPYALGQVALDVEPGAADTLRRVGLVTDRGEDDRLNNGSLLLKINTGEHKFMQLKRSVKAGDLPYFFAVRTQPSARSNGVFPLIHQIGATRYGVLSERALLEPAQLKNAWVFAQKRDVADKPIWRYYHDASFVDVGFRGLPLTARHLGAPDLGLDGGVDDERKAEVAARHDADVIGCLIDRTRCCVELFKVAPNTDALSPAGVVFLSQTACVLECLDEVYPTLSVADGTEDGSIEIVASRFVLDRDEALNVFRETFASY